MQKEIRKRLMAKLTVFKAALVSVLFAGCGSCFDPRPLSSGREYLGSDSGEFKLSGAVELLWILVVYPETQNQQIPHQLHLTYRVSEKAFIIDINVEDQTKTDWLKKEGYDNSYALVKTQAIKSILSKSNDQRVFLKLLDQDRKETEGYLLWLGYSRKGMGKSPIEIMPIEK